KSTRTGSRCSATAPSPGTARAEGRASRTCPTTGSFGVRLQRDCYPKFKGFEPCPRRECSRDTFSLSAGCYVISSTTHFESINVYSYTVLLPRPPGDGWKNFEENGRVDGSNWPLERVLIWAQKTDNGQ